MDLDVLPADVSLQSLVKVETSVDLTALTMTIEFILRKLHSQSELIGSQATKLGEQADVLATHTHRFARLDSRLGTLDTRMATVERLCTSGASSGDATQHNTSLAIKRLEQKLNALEAASAAERATAAAARLEAATVTTAQAAVSKEAASASASLKAAVAANSESIRACETGIAAHSATLVDLGAASATTAAAAADNHEAVQRLQLDTGALQSAVNGCEQQNTHLTARCDVVESNMSECVKAAALTQSNAARHAAIRLAVDEMSIEMGELRGACARATAAQAAFQPTLTALVTRVGGHDSQLGGTATRNDVAEKVDKAVFRDEKRALIAELATRESAEANARDIAAVRADCAALQRDVTTLVSSGSRLLSLPDAAPLSSAAATRERMRGESTTTTTTKAGNDGKGDVGVTLSRLTTLVVNDGTNGDGARRGEGASHSRAHFDKTVDALNGKIERNDVKHERDMNALAKEMRGALQALRANLSGSVNGGGISGRSGNTTAAARIHFRCIACDQVIAISRALPCQSFTRLCFANTHLLFALHCIPSSLSRCRLACRVLKRGRINCNCRVYDRLRRHSGRCSHTRTRTCMHASAAAAAAAAATVTMRRRAARRSCRN
jgi:hypothetical protein